MRQKAVGALGRVAKDAEEAPERRAVREILAEMLDDRLFRVRIAAADALVAAGDGEQLAVLRRVASSHPHELTRARVRDRVAALEKSSAQAATVTELRKELDDERKKREELEERVREIETRMPEKKRDASE